MTRRTHGRVSQQTRADGPHQYSSVPATFCGGLGMAERLSSEGVGLGAWRSNPKGIKSRQNGERSRAWRCSRELLNADDFVIRNLHCLLKSAFSSLSVFDPCGPQCGRFACVGSCHNCSIAQRETERKRRNTNRCSLFLPIRKMYGLLYGLSQNKS